jgi:hypothetical protein
MTADKILFQASGRTPAAYMALFLGMACTFLAWRTSAPAIIWALTSVLQAVVLWRMAFGNRPTLRLTETTVVIDQPRKPRAVPLDRVALVELTDWRDGPAACALILTDGTRVELPHSLLPGTRALAAELADRGIEVQRTMPSQALQ